MQKLVSVLFVVALLCLSFNSHASNLDSFEEFLTQPGNITDKILKVIHAAKDEDAEAQYILARLLYIGYGVKRDKNNAEKWLDRAVDSGFNDAVYMKGLIILQNEDGYTPQSRVGENLLLTLANNDHQEALEFLAHGYAIGDQLPLNPSKANTLYQQLFKFAPRRAINQAIESFATAIGLYRLDDEDLIEQYRQSLFTWHKKAIDFEEYKRCSSIAYAYQDTETQTAWRYFCKNAGQRDKQLSLQLIDSEHLLSTEQQKVVQEKATWLQQNVPFDYKGIPPF